MLRCPPSNSVRTLAHEEEEEIEMSFMDRRGSPEDEGDDDDVHHKLLPAAQRDSVTAYEQDGNGAGAAHIAAPIEEIHGSRIYKLTFLAAISGFMFGYDTGIVSGAMLLIVKDLGLENNTFEQELIVSATLVGCIVASVGSKTLTEGAGRRTAILVAAFTFTVGAAVMWVARATPNPFYCLVAGRFIVGLGVGLASMVTPLYIGEVAPSSIRGRLVTLNNVFITGGQFVACVVAGLLANYNYPHGWELMLGLSGIPSALQFVGMLTAVESPRWLAKYKGRAAATAALRSIRPVDETALEVEVSGIMKSIVEEDKLQESAFGFFDLFRSSTLRSIMAIGVGLQAIQQLSGINTVMYYFATITVMAGWTDVSEAIWITAGVSFIGFLANVIGMTQVERRGRRCLVLTSLGGVVVALAVLGLAFFQLRATSPKSHPSVPSVCDFSNCYDCATAENCGYCDGLCVEGNYTSPKNASVCPSKTAYHGQACPATGFNWGYIALGSTAMYLSFFQAGMGPAPWVINSEIFPLRAKSVGVATTTAVNWTCNLLIAFTFLDLCKAITAFGAFWLYGGIALVGFVWFAVALPETRGKRLEDIEALFSGQKKKIGHDRGARHNVSVNTDDTTPSTNSTREALLANE